MTTAAYRATVPTNIALLKYWGKKDEAKQWPANDSLSLTISNLNTVTTAKGVDRSDHSFCLGGEQLVRSHPMAVKVFNHLDFISTTFDLTAKLTIETANSFPTGCGIASSASGLAALTVAALGAWLNIDDMSEFSQNQISEQRLCELARLGSGSACRSLHGGIVKWQKGEDSNSQTVEQLFPRDFWPLSDTIVLFSEQVKKVSSSTAHRSAWSSPLFPPRLAGLNQRRSAMESAIAERRMDLLGPLIETETLEMHGVIMSANPPVHYFGASTGEFLAFIRNQRQLLKLPVYFTLDAGPNVHLIYESQYQRDVEQLIKAAGYDNFLTDEVGDGPKLEKLS